MRHYAGLFDAINAGQAQRRARPQGRGRTATRALELAAEADVLVEGFRPGVLAQARAGRAGRAGAEPRPSSTAPSPATGSTTPAPRCPGHDVNYQAWAGALAPEGGTARTIPPLPTADLAAGLTAAFGICAAVLGRVTSGEGAYLDISMTDVLATWTGPAGAGPADGARVAGPLGAHARLRALRDGRRRAGGAGRGQRAALLVEPLRGARTGGHGGARLRRAVPARGASCSTPSARPSRHGPATSWSPAWSPPACPWPRCSTARGCWPQRRSPPFPIRLPLPDGAAARPRARPAPRRGLRRARLTTARPVPCCYGPSDAMTQISDLLAANQCVRRRTRQRGRPTSRAASGRRHLHGRPHRRLRRARPASRRGARDPQRRRAGHRRRAAQPGALERCARGGHRRGDAAHQVRPGRRQRRASSAS